MTPPGPLAPRFEPLEPLPEDGKPSLGLLAQMPEDSLWLANFTSDKTRETYRQAILQFVKAAGLHNRDDFQHVSRAAVIAWRDQLMREGRSRRTVKNRLSALSSLFDHLTAHGVVEKNVVKEVDRPKLNSQTGVTPALSVDQARKLLDAPPKETLRGLRDRAILSVGLQVGPRRAEIAKLLVGDFHEEQGFPALMLNRKGGADGSVVINPQTAQRIREYLEHAGHGQQVRGPLFRPIRVKNRYTEDPLRALAPREIWHVFKRWSKAIGLDPVYSSHSMRATCATRALENGASLEEVQRLLGHANPATTKLYDRRGYNPERSASFFATY